MSFIAFQCGYGKDWVFGMEKRDPLHMEFEDNLVTSDRARFARAKALIAGGSRHPPRRADLGLAGSGLSLDGGNDCARLCRGHRHAHDDRGRGPRPHRG